MDKGFKCSYCLFSRKDDPVLPCLPARVRALRQQEQPGAVDEWAPREDLTGTPVPALHPGRTHNQGSKSSCAASLWLSSYSVEGDRRDSEARQLL